MVPAGNSLEPLLCPGKTVWGSLLWCKAVAPKAQLSLEPHATSFCFPTAGTRYNRELLMPWRAQLMGRMCLLYTRSRFFSVKGDCISSWALMKHNFCFEELTTGLPQIVTFTDPWKHRNQKQRCSVMESYSSAGMKNCFLTWACFFFPPFFFFFFPQYGKKPSCGVLMSSWAEHATVQHSSVFMTSGLHCLAKFYAIGQPACSALDLY